jgi:hypothetical protein
MKPPAFVANPVWDKRLDFVKKWFDRESKDYEQITVAPSDVAGLPLINITYETVKNKNRVEWAFGLSPALLTLLTDATVVSILKELMEYFRSKK